MEGNIVQYLSNLFTKIVFKNKDNTVITQAETSDYFDQLEIIAGDDYITFSPEPTGSQSPVKSVKISLDTDTLKNTSEIKMYCHDPENDGHIVFSYSPTLEE